MLFPASPAVQASEAGRGVVLVRPFRKADGVAGFKAARGVVTAEGGKASHAALVARGMGLPAVCGVGELEIDLAERRARVNGTVLEEGDMLALDGTLGVITTDDVPMVEPEVDPNFETVLGWSDEVRTLGVRANADTPEDARRAREFGAEGIGLCRTEHMFFGEERQERMVQGILADSDETRRAALDELLPLQQGDFEGLFAAMEGRPVTIRLLDPPLHEFLPDRATVQAEVERARIEGSDDPEDLE